MKVVTQMKFKCNTSGCVYSFEAPLDIASMLKSQDYTPVPDAPAPEAVKEPATIVPVAPVKPGPNKPLPVVPVVPKAV